METTTENGAKSLSTTSSALLDFFFKVVRNTPEETTIKLLQAALKENPQLTFKAVFQLRDCRGGKGEKQQFYTCVRYLASSEWSAAINRLIKYIPEYGTFKDIFYISDGNSLDLSAMHFYAGVLIADYNSFQGSLVPSIRGKLRPVWTLDAVNSVNDGNSNESNTSELDSMKTVNISLAAKWAPTEGGSLDRKQNAVKRLINGFKSHKSKDVKNFRQYRVLVSELRQHLNIVESYMCKGLWNEIKYPVVPSVAMNLHRKAFTKHDEPRLTQYISDVRAGKKTINSGQLFLHQLVASYMKGNASSFIHRFGLVNSDVVDSPSSIIMDNDRDGVDQVVEAQWKTLVEIGKKQFVAAGIRPIPLSDVSASMRGTPMEVSIALGIYLSEISSAFPGTIITFSETPSFFKINPDDTLRDKVARVQNAPWGSSTNFILALELILDSAVTFGTPPDRMPTHLYVFSDMQFNQANSSGGGGGKASCFNETNFEVLEEKYKAAGYERPTIVFWNLRGDTNDFPVHKDISRVALVSGFSQQLMKSISSGDVVSPVDVMMKALTDSRYELINCVL